MNMLSFPSTKNPLHIATTTLCSMNFKPPKTLFKPRDFPARDRVIDFGKYKGKMLGALPSTYLKWVSKNLRARDFEEWAKLADQVLDDPFYKDRIEWEFAEKLLTGDVKQSKYHSPVSELLELSERFGWDNDDKLGWSKIDFSILGTSRGGRIPRLDQSGKMESLKPRMMNVEIQRLGGSRKVESLNPRMMNKEIKRLDGSRKNESLNPTMMNKEIQRLDISRKMESLNSTMMNERISRLDGSRKIESSNPRMMNKAVRRLDGSRKMESLNSTMMNEGIQRLDGSRKTESWNSTMMNEGIAGGNEGVGETRKERRERIRSRRSGGDSMKELRDLVEKMNLEEKNEGRLASSDGFNVKGDQDVDERGNVEIQSRFPGREGLIRKVLLRRTPF